MKILINEQDSGIDVSALSTMNEVVELIKNSIDPEHMITGLLINGEELSEDDWSAGLGRFTDATLLVSTGRPADYVAERIQVSSGIVRNCYLIFRDARKSFQDGNMQEGNEQLIGAVKDLQAFFEWYGTMLELVPEDERSKYRMDEKIEKISETCKKICQQQLYQSWWALGETLEKELEPELDKVEDFCRRVAQGA